MKRLLPILLACCLAQPAAAVTVHKSFAYFTVHGRTLDEIQSQLSARGPKLNGKGERHPGATRMEFNTRISYAQSNGRCRWPRRPSS